MANQNNSDSDNESPDVISTTAMKSKTEDELRELLVKKAAARQELKLQRKLKMEKYMNEKKVKKSKRKGAKEIELVPVEVSSVEDTADVTEGMETGISEAEVINPLKRKSRFQKTYPELNITVQSLSKIVNSRAAVAHNFKATRLAKIPREDISKTLISYQEKLRSKNT